MEVIGGVLVPRVPPKPSIFKGNFPDKPSSYWGTPVETPPNPQFFGDSTERAPVHQVWGPNPRCVRALIGPHHDQSLVRSRKWRMRWILMPKKLGSMDQWIDQSDLKGKSTANHRFLMGVLGVDPEKQRLVRFEMSHIYDFWEKKK